MGVLTCKVRQDFNFFFGSATTALAWISVHGGMVSITDTGPMGGTMTSDTHTTHIQNADWVIAWDDTADDHIYRRNCDVVFDAGGIRYVGSNYQGPPADEVMDANGLMVMPGLISTHSHLNGGNLATGFLEEVLDPYFQHSPMYTRKGPFWKSDVATPGRDNGRWFKAAMRHAQGELMASGVTTVVDIQGANEHGQLWCDLAAQSGLRTYLAPCFQEAFWAVRDSRVLDHEWNVEAGRAAYDLACATLDLVEEHACDRLHGMVAPAQVDTCTESLMVESKALAKSRGLVWQTHCAQSVPEFRAMIARTGLTPVGWLDDIGVLDDSSIIGHGIYLDHHSSLGSHSRGDLDALAQCETTVAHCPITFSRWGTTLENFGRYRDAGVRMALGNDTGPHNMLEEMRCAFTQGRINSHAPAQLAMSDIFRAATTGGARALGRTDIGRLNIGSRADIVLVDLGVPSMRPGFDPLRSLVFVAADRAVRDVYVEGRLIYAQGAPSGFDASAASQELSEALAIQVREISDRDDVPPMHEIATSSFPIAK